MVEIPRKNDPAEPEKRSEEEILQIIGLKKGQRVRLSEDYWINEKKGTSAIIKGIDDEGDLIIEDKNGVFVSYLRRSDLTKEWIVKNFILEEPPSGEKAEIKEPPLSSLVEPEEETPRVESIQEEAAKEEGIELEEEPAEPAGETEKRSEEEAPPAGAEAGEKAKEPDLLERLGLQPGERIEIKGEGFHKGKTIIIRGVTPEGALAFDFEGEKETPDGRHRFVGSDEWYLRRILGLEKPADTGEAEAETVQEGGEAERTEIKFPSLSLTPEEEEILLNLEEGEAPPAGEKGGEAKEPNILEKLGLQPGERIEIKIGEDAGKIIIVRGVNEEGKLTFDLEGEEQTQAGVWIFSDSSEGNLRGLLGLEKPADTGEAEAETVQEGGEAERTEIKFPSLSLTPEEEEVLLNLEEGEAPPAGAEAAEGEGEEKEEVKKEKKRKMPNEFKEILGEEEAGWEKWQKEQQRGVLKTLEQKTGFSLAFSPEQWTLIKRIITDRFSLVMSARAEEWLLRHRDKAEKQGVDLESKGGVAVDAVIAMGAWNELFEKGDSELERIKLAKRAVDEFSSRDIPPSARFAILEQLEQIPHSENTDEVKRIRIETFKKWSGRETEIGEEDVNQVVQTLFLGEVLPKRAEEEVKKLTPNERIIAAECGLRDIDFVMARDAGYKVRKESKHKRWLKLEQRIVWYDPKGEEVENMWGIMGIIRDSWQKKVMSEEEPRLRERAKLDLDSSFVEAVVSEKGESQLRNIYKSLKNDIETQYHTRKMQEAKKGEKTMEEGEEVLEQKGKTVKSFARSILTGEGRFGNLSGSLEDDEDALLEEMRENWGFDITPEQLDAFQKEAGFEYNKFSQKKRGLLYFMLRLAAHSFQEAKKISSQL